jgi:twitching motility protein PilT
VRDHLARPAPRRADAAECRAVRQPDILERRVGGGDVDRLRAARARRGQIARSETAGGDPDGFAGGAGGRAARGIERSQYAAPGAGHAASGGSALLDHLTAGGRAAYASDIYLSAGSPAFQRIGGELTATADRAPIDRDTLARELGQVAPSEARSAWAERGLAVFAYGDGAGRVRVTLTRDHRGPGATLRLLPAEAPPLAGLGLDGVTDWLRDRGLVIVAGPSGCGKTTALAALVRALGEQRRRVIAIEDPIELVHVSAWISQRAIGDHVRGVGDGVAAAMREGVDAIAIGAVQSAADAAAVIEAVAGGHLVLTTVTVPRAGVGLERLLDRLPLEQSEVARTLCEDAYLGTIGPVVTRAGRSGEVAPGRRRMG